MIRVLIVDDDALVRSGLQMMLSGAPGLEVVGEDGTAARYSAQSISTGPTSSSWTYACRSSTASRPPACS